MPDLNSVPPSPHVLAASRQSLSVPPGGIASPPPSGNSPGHNAPTASSPSTALGSSSTATQMPTPPVLASPSSTHVFPSNQMAVNHAGPTIPSPFSLPSMPFLSGVPAHIGDGPGVGPGPGPLRHPRPLTAAELHMQLEKEQEAVVNRLTRELTLLRAQNASVVSNASSTSAGGGSDAASSSAVPTPSSTGTANGPGEFSFFSGMTGFSIPSSAGRHNRTYSNTSSRSQTAVAGSTPSVVGITAPAPIRPLAPGLSRQNSTTSRRSRANSPGAPSQAHSYTPSHVSDASASGHLQQQQNHFLYARGASVLSAATTPSASEAMSTTILPGTARYEDAAFYRAELENVRRENEALKRRIRELERTASAASATPSQQQQQRPRERRERRSSEISRGRSESISTAASASLPTVPSLGSAVAAASTSSVGLSSASATALASASSSVSMSVSVSGSASASASAGIGAGGVAIAGRRASGRGRAQSGVAVGVPDDEVRVGESAASAGLRLQQAQESQGGPGQAASMAL